MNNKEETNIRKNKWAEENREKVLKYKKEYQSNYNKNNQKIAESRRLALKVKLEPCCEICGSIRNLERHHWRYDKPLLVNTLCSTCHRIQHIKHFEYSIYARSVQN